MQEQKPEINKDNSKILQIVTEVSTAENILIALSQNPTADELAAAIALSLYLDKAGKHATAIYSGKTPSILEFLEPEERLETNTDSLQDFIIAINKEKADHLRYKVEGDYVRVYITPYKTKISEEDLEFSHGDFNIDLVVALNVPTINSLDRALSNHGRILHDAEVINIAAAPPSDFGTLEWSDPSSSSVSEMVADLMFRIEEEINNPIDGEIATALLTGVFVATERFSNERTQPETMNLAAKLMSMGANQKLISEYMKKAETSEVQKEDAATVQETGAVPINDTGDIQDMAVSNSPEGGVDDLKDEQIIDVMHEDEKSAGLQTKEEGKGALQGGVIPPIAELDSKQKTVSPLGSEQSKLEEPGVLKDTKLGENKIQPLGVSTVQTELGKDAGGPKVDLGQTTTLFGNAPVPGFVDQKDTPNLGMSSSQPTNLAMGNSEATLSGIGSGPSLNKSVMDELKNLSNGSAENPDAKIDQPQVSTGSFLSGNPALVATPEVSEGPEENHIPGLDFGSPVSMGEDEPAFEKKENSFILGEQQPVQGNASDLSIGESTQQPISNATLEPKPQGMPLPGDEILPPPPTPPIDFGTVSAAAPVDVEKPASQSISFLNLGQNETTGHPDFNAPASTTPSLPQVDQSLLGQEQPTASAQNSPKVLPSQQPTVNADPGAFRIPGT